MSSRDIYAKKNILITGGTGSFGQAFTKYLLTRHPEVERIVIFSRDEFKQFEMSNKPEFIENKKLRFFVGDVRDKDRLLRAFDGIDLVIHAAALKQVPSCEYNPFEAVKTNILGAQNVIDAAIDRNVEKVVALSTDKACNPINLYGATKLCSDKLFVAGNAYVGNRRTRFSVVRYGNVAGSRGSVIPYFKSIIEQKEKTIPVTDENMTRFWLKLSDAVKMVHLAIEKMSGGELFVCKIPSFKITDLVKAMMPNAKIKITGIRPGEKIHEVMISTDDARNTLEFEKYFVVQPDFVWWNREAFSTYGGKAVSAGFQYSSGSNSEWLTVEEIASELGDLYVQQ